MEVSNGLFIGSITRYSLAIFSLFLNDLSSWWGCANLDLQRRRPERPLKAPPWPNQLNTRCILSALTCLSPSIEHRLSSFISLFLTSFADCRSASPSITTRVRVLPTFDVPSYEFFHQHIFHRDSCISHVAVSIRPFRTVPKLADVDPTTIMMT